MKKFLVILLSSLILVLAAGCVISSPKNPGTDTPGPGTTETPSGDSTFTVTLTCDGGPFEDAYPEYGIAAQWTSVEDGSVKEALFNTRGVASIDGLDGNYVVTVINLPANYAYNPNSTVAKDKALDSESHEIDESERYKFGYLATNENKNIKIKTYKLTSTSGKGIGWYEDRVMTLPKSSGVYKFTFTAPGQQIYCVYNPPISGKYYIESWADITANEINPRMTVYQANRSAVFQEIVLANCNASEDVACADFTKNFIYRVETDNVNTSCAFILRCDSRSFPQDVVLCVGREGEFNFVDYGTFDIYMPKEQFKQTPEYGSKLRYIYEDDSNNVLRGERVGFNESDGYYHLLDDEGRPDGAILYAKISGMITSPTGANVINFQQMSNYGQMQGERGLNLYIKGVNYTFMIQGYKGLETDRHPDADKFKDLKSYIDYVNSDGVYAVTSELKNFLQAYCVENQFFYDGLGWAEGAGYMSSDANQWLFACGYYR